MTIELRPRPGFDWSKVVWGKPHEVRTDKCSYCREPLGDEEVPLILSSSTGYVAEFCDRCKTTWWGFDSSDDDDDERNASAVLH